MDLKTMREYAEKYPEQPKSNWPTYEKVKNPRKSSTKLYSICSRVI